MTTIPSTMSLNATVKAGIFDLGRFRISSKVFTVIGVLAAVAVGIAIAAVIGLSAMRAATDAVQADSGAALVGTRMNQNVLRMRRMGFWLAANPSREVAGEVAKVTTEQRRQFEDRLKEVVGQAKGERKKLLEKVAADYRVYSAEIDKIMSLASRTEIKNQLEGSQKELLDAMVKNNDTAEILEDAVRQFNKYNERKSAEVAEEARQTYLSLSWVISISAVLGILAGLALGWVISSAGIVNPIRRAV